jgi:predicted membrane channel-forming protein YqfA (hemolysin III family)
MEPQLSDREKIDRAARHEEVRFTKKQQWSVTTSAVTLLAAIFGIAQLVKPGPHERWVATLFIVIILGSAWLFLWKLQDHLSETRTLLDPNDCQPWLRGGDVLAVLLGTVSFSAYVVCYYVWR